MTTPIADIDQVRQMLRDLESLLGLRGSFRPQDRAPQMEPLDSPEQLGSLFRELLVQLFGMEVRGL
jgi:hypothetical protein